MYRGSYVIDYRLSLPNLDPNDEKFNKDDNRIVFHAHVENWSSFNPSVNPSTGHSRIRAPFDNTTLKKITFICWLLDVHMLLLRKPGMRLLPIFSAATDGKNATKAIDWIDFRNVPVIPARAHANSEEWQEMLKERRRRLEPAFLSSRCAAACNGFSYHNKSAFEFPL